MFASKKPELDSFALVSFFDSHLRKVLAERVKNSLSIFVENVIIHLPNTKEFTYF